jgi:hypothetical protein
MRSLAFPIVLSFAAGSAFAQTAFYQRATQGATGQSGGGIATTDQFYSGWRFQVTDGPVRTVNVGGHFYSGFGTVFGAIVALSGPDDDPDSIDLTGADVLGVTNPITLPPYTGGSQVIQGPLSLTLQNGWYLVVFGSGRFGASSTGGGLQSQDASTATPGAQLNITYRQPTSPFGPGVFLQSTVARVFVEYSAAASCYANCDASTTVPVLNVLDFTCFLQKFAAADPYANCDASTVAPVLNVLDFTCFLQKFAAGCP